MFLNLRSRDEEEFLVIKNQADFFYNSRDYVSAFHLYKKIINKIKDQTLYVKITARMLSCVQHNYSLGDRGYIVSHYKKIINDYTLPPLGRGLIVNDLAEFLSTQPVDFIFNHFSEFKPLSLFFKKELMSNDLFKDLFLIELYKYSNEIYENSLAQINHAFMLARLITKKWHEDRGFMLEKGEEAFGLVQRGQEIMPLVSYDKYLIVKQYFNISVVLQTCHNRLGKPDQLSVKQSYITALSESLKDKSESFLQIRTMIRVHLAEFLRRYRVSGIEVWEPFLVDIFNDKDDKDKVGAKTLYLMLADTTSVYYRKAVLRLALSSPYFKHNLLKLGCSEKDFIL